eukprot:scaffold905_cov153-Ochromonas_danica.AAC.1
MAYELQVDPEYGYGNAGPCFVVAFSIDNVPFKAAKLNFLRGIAIAIFVAAFDLDEESDRSSKICEELDVKAFAPKRPHASSANLASMDNNLSSSYTESPSLSLRKARMSSKDELINVVRSTSKPILNTSLGGFIQEEITPSPSNGLSSDNDGYFIDLVGSLEDHHINDAIASTPDEVYQHGDKTTDTVNPVDQQVVAVSNSQLSCPSPIVVPTWDPASSFCFPIAQVPVKYPIQDNLTFSSFTQMKHIADGSNANIYTARLKGERVIIKIIKEKAEKNPIALQEFDLEFGTLARVDHPNIIKVLGSGHVPRRFIVLEHLAGGSLNSMLQQHQQTTNSRLAHRLFHKPTFTYEQLLRNAKSMAEALEYLHSKCHPGATIIHRDLKPDNVGFTVDGKLKLFDFGLVTTVKARSNPNDAYEMTGQTGSLRYMAPEVVLRRPYSEKVDVYSFAIMLWQMARDRVPFKSYDKEEFLKSVVMANERPKLHKSWPPGFSELLAQCWEADPALRPCFGMIVKELNKLLLAEIAPATPVGRDRSSKSKAAAIGDARLSGSWF